MKLTQLLRKLRDQNFLKPNQSVLRILQKLLPKKDLQRVLLATPDRRRITESVSKQFQIPEDRLLLEISQRLELGFLQRVAPMDVSLLGTGITLADFVQAGCIAVTTEGMITGLVCVDPAFVEGSPVAGVVAPRARIDLAIPLRANNFRLYLGSWSSIARALDESEKNYLEEQARQKVEKERKNRELIEKVLGAIVSEVESFSKSSFDLHIDSDQISYLFTTKDLKIAKGRIDTRIRDSLLQVLEGLSTAPFFTITLPATELTRRVKLRIIEPNMRLRLDWSEEPGEIARPDVSDNSSLDKKIVYFPTPDLPARVGESHPKLHDAKMSLVTDKTPPPSKTPRVLVVDDNATFAKVLERFLAREGLETLYAENGDKALLALKAAEELPDLIVCDVHMPGMNGFEFLHLIRKDPHLFNIPVIVLTSDGDVETELKLLSDGADAFVRKNEDPRILSVHVRRLIEKELNKRAA